MRGVLGAVLLSIIALYLLSFMIVKLPFFSVREYSVVGIRSDERSILRDYLRSVGNRIILLPESVISKDLNKKFGNRFKSISVKKEFTRKGVVINLKFNRRIPVAKVILGREVYLIDKNGSVFRDKVYNNLPSINVRTQKELKSLGKKLALLARFGDKVIISSDKVIIKRRSKKYIMPSIKLIGRREIEILRYALQKNLRAKVIDLRYKKFILLR